MANLQNAKEMEEFKIIFKEVYERRNSGDAQGVEANEVNNDGV